SAVPVPSLSAEGDGTPGMDAGASAVEAHAAPGVPAGGTPPVDAAPRLVSPARMLADLRELSPGFEPRHMDYHDLDSERPSVRIHGVDPNYMMRYDAFAIMHPYTGEMINASYLPGHTDGWTSWLTVFFALHFATFGGAAEIGRASCSDRAHIKVRAAALQLQHTQCS